MNHPLARDLDEIMAHAAPDLWEPLRGHSIFVTGGTGFVGTWLMESLAWANDNLQLDANAVILTRDPERFHKKAPAVAKHKSFELLRGNCLDFTFPSGHFRYVIHAATESPRPATAESPDATFDTDVGSTRRVLEFAKQTGAHKLLFTSSGAVYGTQPKELERIPEDYPGAPSPMDPKSAYAQAKRASEFLCAMYSRQFGFDALIARLFAFVGPHLSLEAYAVGNFLRDAMSGRPIRIESDGSTVRSYLYASELAVWLWTILLRGEPLHSYNVGSSNAVTVRDLAQRVATVVGNKVRVEVLGRTGVPATRYVPDTLRAEKELGLRPRISLEEGLLRTMEWHRVRALQPQS
jgi:dTDP-glucose 4,6-dehydratase